MESNRTLEMAQKMEKVRASLALAYGDKWQKMVAEMSPMIQDIMDAEKTVNPIEGVLHIARQDPQATENTILLGVAAEMCLTIAESRRIAKAVASN